MSARVLIVEDEAIPALELRMRLELWGFEVLRTESSGESAIASAREHEPDLVIMDVVLADALDGLGAADAIQARRRVPVLFLTANEDRVVRRAAAAAPRETISKPYSADDLRAAIRRLLG
jgi:DNA-binding NarL/FixJ family response regulator